MTIFQTRACNPFLTTTYMSSVIVITNRRLCADDFLERIKDIACARPQAIILREKDLSEGEYKVLAEKVIKICSEYKTDCILHTFVGVAKSLGVKNIHLPLGILKTLSKEDREYFAVLGVSCHSVTEAKEAQSLGATYITASHVFETDCKRGLPARGLNFLKEVTESVDIPVYGLGGITHKNAKEVFGCGAEGVCVMSGAMVEKNAHEYIARFEEEKR